MEHEDRLGGCLRGVIKSKRKNILSRQILYLAKITSKNEDKIKIFSDKQQFVKFIVRIPTLQKKC